MKAFGNGIDRRVRLALTETEVWRGIMPAWQDFYRRLWEEGTFIELCRQGLLVASEAVAQIDGTEGVLQFRQPRLPFVAYPFEWSAAMFRAAAEKCLDLHEALWDQDLCLTDSHPWNLVFRGSDPQWVDLTSITAYDAGTVEAGLRQFRSCFLHPLTLLNEGQGEIARALLTHPFADVSDGHADSILSSGEWRSLPWFRRIPRALLAAQAKPGRILGREWRKYACFGRVDFHAKAAAHQVARRLRRELAAIRPRGDPNEWTTYVQAGQADLSAKEISERRIDERRLENTKLRILDKWLATLKAESRTLLDLGCNKGLFTQMAWLQGYEAAGVDTDHGAIDCMYQVSRAGCLPVHCAVNDFVAPREAAGMLTNPLPTFAERFQADVILAFAVVHHLYFGRYLMDFERIVQLLGLYARKYLIVEFVPPGDGFLRGHYAGAAKATEYTSENFRQAVERLFRVLEIGSSFPSGRTIWVLQKL